MFNRIINFYRKKSVKVVTENCPMVYKIGDLVFDKSTDKVLVVDDVYMYWWDTYYDAQYDTPYDAGCVEVSAYYLNPTDEHEVAWFLQDNSNFVKMN